MNTPNMITKINIDSGAFKWVSSLTFTLKNFSLTPQMRSIELNALITMTCFYIKERFGKNPEDEAKENTLKLLKYLAENLHTFIYEYCKMFLDSQSVVITPEIHTALEKKIIQLNLKAEFEKYFISLTSGQNSTFFLENSISHFSLDSGKEDTYISELCQEFLSTKVSSVQIPQLERITELSEGMNVCGFELLRKIRDRDGCQIWKAKRGNYYNVLKLQDSDLEGKELAKLLSVKKSDKIIDHFKETDIEYKNYQNLKDFKYKVDFFGLDYYSPLNFKVKILSWLDGPINIVEDKKAFLSEMTGILMELHQLGYCYDNIMPNHIMINPNSPPGISKYRLVDYKYLTKIKDPVRPKEDNYRSLRLLTTDLITPYDDMESLMYTFDEIISNKKEYTDRSDSINKKTYLNCITPLIAECIGYFRQMSQYDEYAVTDNTIIDFNQYIQLLYFQGININGNMYSFNAIIEYILGKYIEVSPITIDLPECSRSMLEMIRSQFKNDPRFTHISNDNAKFNDITLKILNFIINSSMYPNDQDIINEFLR